MPSLFKRGEVWYINYRLNGRQYRRSTKTANRRLADIALNDLELRLFRGDLMGPKSETLDLEQIFRRYILHVEDNTVPEYARHVRKYLESWALFFAEKDIIKPQDIDLELVDDFLLTVLRDRSPKTKKEYLASLKACLNRAIRWKILENNPIRNASISQKIVRRVNFFSKEDIRKLLENVPSNLESAIGLLVNTGIRLGELWALRWEDVDFSNRQICIRAYEGFTPKGKRDRNVPMNAACHKILKKLNGKREDGSNFVYRFSRSQRALSVQFKYHLEKLQMKGRLHDLRHTFASHLVMSGTPVPVVQELLGHADITTTMVYSHLAPSIHMTEVKKLKF